MSNDKWLEGIDRKVAEERRNYKGPHCCMTMHYGLLNKAYILSYSKKYREYGIKIPGSTGCMLMDYCMFCGKKMPASLRHEWFDILEEEYKLENPSEEDRAKVPQEFWSDEWWKKRGL